MRNRRITTATLILTALTALAVMLFAGETGTIRGIVTDIDTGDPIPGVSISIIGTTTGAMSGPDGRFIITGVNPGMIALRVSSVSFIPLEIVDITVRADSTFELNIKMKKSTTDLNKVIKVTADGDAVNKSKVTSRIDLYPDDVMVHYDVVPFSELNILENAETGDRSSKKVREEKMPVQSVDELLQSTSGVVTTSEGEVIIRGGRAGEISCITDGKTIGDPLGGYNAPKPCREKKTPVCQSMSYFPPAHGGTAIVNGEPYDAMFFKHYGVNPFVDTEDDNLSTFAIDVDDASYVMARSYLERGDLPPDDAIRTEEFINHFDYNYRAPREAPFAIFIEGAPSNFGQNCQMLKIGIQGKVVNPRHRKAANLVFVVDVSGSMRSENRLGLVKSGLRMLVDELKPNDRVGIVVYGSCGRVILEPTSIRRKHNIMAAINRLQPGGSTNAEEGINLGYEMAERYFERGKINRIILCSDGVANVGTTNADELLNQIKRYADRGITLSTVGFGMGNYNDVLMEKLGDKGNGHYAYVDDITEARRVFVENLTGMLQVIARDVKIQVEFDPRVVRSYRLLGYENRDVEDIKFRDDKEDGGEIGSGHSVTALYEVKFKENVRHNKIGTVYIRYKAPNELDEADEVEFTLSKRDFHRRFESASPEFRLAATAAEFAEILRKSYWAKESNLSDLAMTVKGLYRELRNDEVQELMSLISMARQFDEDLAER